MNNFYDVIISGCGPAGSLLGYYLVNNDIRTLIIEKENFPREKICAGGIQHRTLGFIPFDISQVIENKINGIYFSIKNKNIFLKKSPDPIMYTVSRDIFDLFLSGQASQSGCRIKFGEKVLDFSILENHVQLNTSKASYKAKVIVGADGFRGSVHRFLTSGKKIKKIIGYEANIDYPWPEKGQIIKDNKGNVFDLNDSVRLDFMGVKNGYCWVFPKKKKISCGMGAPFKNAAGVKRYLKKFLAESCCYSSSPEILAHGIPVRNEDTPFCGYRIIAVGDAACFCDGFTGEGLYNAARSSEYAASSIIAALKNSDFYFRDYYENIKNDIGRDIKISLLLNMIFYNSVMLFYRYIERNDSYFNSCCRFLRGEKKYSDIAEKIKVFKT